MKVRSLQRRLVVTLLISAPLMWLLAASVALYQTHEEVNELYDGQLTVLAHQLLRNHPAGATIALASPGRRDDDADAPPEAMAQAVWLRDGRLGWHDGPLPALTPVPAQPGFSLRRAGRERWRVLYVRAADGSRTVAVGQRERLRNEMAWQVVASQLFAWLVPLPLLMLGLVLAVRSGLAPLNRLARGLAARPADDLRPIETAVPDEALPLVNALNALFARVTGMLERERRFTADAAHELRSPLAALRVQSEVAILAQDAETRTRALGQLGLGIERAARLIDQLLALSRLDPLQAPAQAEPVDWARLCHQALQDAGPLAARRGMRLDCDWQVPAAEVLPLSGDATLLQLMVRNLLENALRYADEGGTVRLVCTAEAIAVEDDGPGVDPQWLSRIRERFFRPPGQRQSGSGLGLSIVERIARLHRLQLELANRSPRGFCARVRRDDAGAPFK